MSQTAMSQAAPMLPAPRSPRQLVRLADWPLRLEAFVVARQAQPFAWGGQDCALFAADAVQALTGVDVAPPALRCHRHARAALRSLRAHGGLQAIAQAALGTPIPPVLAGVGDVLLTRPSSQSHHPMLAVCNGASALAPGPFGLVSLGLAQVSHAWRVG
jgi:hypothetical protein